MWLIGAARCVLIPGTEPSGGSRQPGDIFFKIFSEPVPTSPEGLRGAPGLHSAGRSGVQHRRLCAWYAATFRSRADRFVPESNMDWRKTIKDNYVDGWAKGFDRRFEVQFL